MARVFARLGDVILDTVYAENPQYGVKSTDHPVEGGGDITDHVQRNPLKMSITGICTGSNAHIRLEKLKGYCDNGALLKYTYRNGISNVIIESFNPTHDAEVLGGFKFSITLKRIRVAKPAVIEGLDYAVAVHVRVPTTGKNGKKASKKASKGKKQAQPVSVKFDPKYALSKK